MLAFTWTALSLLVISVSGINFPKEWCQCIKQYCFTFEGNPHPAILVTKVPSLCKLVSSSTEFLMPTCMLWSPLEQYPAAYFCPKCTATSAVGLTPVRWQDGSSSTAVPRVIHGSDGPVFLVGRVYKCPKGHDILGYHPGLMSQVPVQEAIPFELWHRTGFTCDLMELVHSLVLAGLSISAIAETLQRNRHKAYFRMRHMYHAMHRYLKAPEMPFPSFTDYEEMHGVEFTPSRHSTAAIFLVSFWKRNKLYISEMSKTTVNKDDGWLCCDHTFASVKNIGISRDTDKKWINQYSALFCVLNNIGQIVTWRLTSSVMFSSVEGLLVALQDRLTKQGVKVKEFYVDNCCSWRLKLQSVFGPDLRVVLDIFHAVKRIGDKIPKRHELRCACMDELRMVFRDPSDRGLERTMATPAPDLLVEQLQAFEKRWLGKVSSKGEPVLSAAAQKEIKNVKAHMMKGCLSGIKPGRGTNRNENLHRNINAIMKTSRYGVELAYALLTTCFFQHNAKQLARSDKSRPQYVEELSTECQELATKEQFGLSFETPSNASLAAQDGSPEAIDIIKAPYAEILKHFMESVPAIAGHIAPDTDEVDHDHDAVSTDLDSDTSDSVDITKAKALLLQVLLWMKVHSQLTSSTRFATVGMRLFPFLQQNTENVFMLLGSPSIHHDLAEHQKRLDNTLAAWNMKRVPVDGDGDCIFHSIAFGLQQLSRADNAQALTILRTASSNSTSATEHLVSHLRQLVVSEWMGPNSDKYQSFLASAQLLAEAQRFLQRGVHCGELGDLVITAMANALQIPIVVFTSVPNFPLTTVMPTYNMAATSEPIYVALTQCGAGHFDAVMPKCSTPSDNESIDESQDGKGIRMFCTCGRKKYAKSKACTSTENGYQTRCPCHKASRPCTHLCKCKHCRNELGKTPKPDTGIPKAKRMRAHYSNQQHGLKGKKGLDFMYQVGESTRTGPWSDFEFLLTTAILMEYPDVSDTDTQCVIAHTEAVKAVAEALCLKLPLPSRSHEELQTLIRYCRHKSKEAEKLLH